MTEPHATNVEESDDAVISAEEARVRRTREQPMTQDAARVRLREIADGWKYAYGIDGTVDWANQYADVLIALVREARELLIEHEQYADVRAHRVGLPQSEGRLHRGSRAWLAKVED
uniref:Uncharacterized protein n=1 Tax=viral metagenome TaxID=1070528 RepID=A0A6M3J7F4_9ZZZZ